MSRNLILYFTVKLDETDSIADLWLCVFGASLFGHACYRKIPVTRKSRNKVELKLTTAQPRLSSPIYCWVYRVELQGKQRYMTRVGFTTATLGNAEQGKQETLVDITGVRVGRLQLELNEAELAGVQIYDDSDEQPVPITSLTQLQREAEIKLDKTPWGEQQTNITDQLPHFIFKTVSQHIGAIPMWAFTILNLETTEKPSAAYFEQALHNAKYLLQTPTIDFQNRRLVAELLNEMQTMPVRAMLYVLDQSGDRFIDDWINPLLSPNQSLVGMDCEDAVQRMIQEASWLGRQPPTENKELNQLVEIEKSEYITFLAAMTLMLPNKTWVYHAAGLKLDRSYVLRRLGILQVKEARGYKPDWWPAVLLEGTAYTTGCWAYEPAKTADRIAQNSTVQFDGGVDTICKVSPAVMAQKNLYGPIQSLFSYELAHDYGIVQIELGENGRRAAKPQSLMKYDTSVQWIPIRLDQKQVNEQLERLKQEAFPATPVPEVARKANRPAITSRANVKLDFCVRAADWNDSLLTQLEGKPRVTRLDLASDLQLVHVTV